MNAIGFVPFVTDVLGVTLTPAQRVLCLVAFDGMDPAQLDDDERALAVELFGSVDVVPEVARDVVAIVAGARSGKSYLLALRLLHLALVVPLDTLAAGEVAFAVIVAPDTRLGRQVLRYAAGAAAETPALAGCVVSSGADRLELRRPHDGRMVRLEVLPATRGGGAVRGRSLVGAVLDEAAFFRDAESVVNDADVYRAVAPRVVPAGQVVIGSTPWAEAGLLYDFWHNEHGAPATAIVAHAPTTTMRPSMAALVERERQRDPDNAAREYDAQFLPVGSGQFFDQPTLTACTFERPANLEPSTAPTVRVGCGVDFAYRSDASAIVVVRYDGERLRVVELLELRPEPGEPLQPSEVVARFAAVSRRHRVTQWTTDLHYIESTRELAHRHGIGLVEAPNGQRGKAAVYQRTRDLMREGQLELSNEHRELLRQLADVRSKATSGGGLSVYSPRKGGSHGDLVSALTLACWAQRHAFRRGHEGLIRIPSERRLVESPAVAPRPKLTADDFPPGARNITGRAFTDPTTGARRFLITD